MFPGVPPNDLSPSYQDPVDDAHRLQGRRPVRVVWLKAVASRHPLTVVESSAYEKRMEDLEADRDTLLRDMADMLPEALDGLSGEERHRLYGMLRMEVTPIPEGFRVSGALSDTFRSFGPTGRRR